MPLMSGFGALEKLPWERINDKIERRVLAGKHGMIVWWKIKAGAHAGAHQHPHEQIVWMLKGKMDFRIGNERRSMIGGDVAVIPGGTEHEGFFSEDTEVVDIFVRHRAKTFSPGVRHLICVRRDQVTKSKPGEMIGMIRRHREASGSCPLTRGVPVRHRSL